MSFSRLFLVFCLFAYSAVADEPPVEATIYTQGGEKMLMLELARTPIEREHGLMNRDTLRPGDGMIFLFPKASDYEFWMKNTRIPLDILFIDNAQTVVHIETQARPNTFTHHRAGQPVSAVIELDGGRAAREGIAVGDKVRYVLPRELQVE